MHEPALAPNGAFAAVLLVVAVAAAVKSALGFGFPLISVPLAANLIGPRTAVVLIAIPVVLVNLLAVVRGGGTAAELRRLAATLAGLGAGTVLGAQLLSRLDPGALAVLLGLVSLAYAALAWTDRLPEVSARGHRYLGPVVGLGAGVMGGTTGIFAPLFASYLHSLRLEKRAFVFWLAVAFTLGGLAQVVSYYRLGLYTPALAGYAAATCVPVVAGTQVGFWIQDRLPSTLFRRLVLLLVVASGLNLVARGLR